MRTLLSDMLDHVASCYAADSAGTGGTGQARRNILCGIQSDAHLSLDSVLGLEKPRLGKNRVRYSDMRILRLRLFAEVAGDHHRLHHSEAQSHKNKNFQVGAAFTIYFVEILRFFSFPAL